MSPQTGQGERPFLGHPLSLFPLLETPAGACLSLLLPLLRVRGSCVCVLATRPVLGVRIPEAVLVFVVSLGSFLLTSGEQKCLVLL